MIVDCTVISYVVYLHDINMLTNITVNIYA